MAAVIPETKSMLSRMWVKAAPFLVNYSRTPCEVYCNLVRIMIKYLKNLKMLCLWHSASEPSIPGLPSWAPDWTLTSKSTFFDPLEGGHGDSMTSKNSVPDNRSPDKKPTLEESGTFTDSDLSSMASETGDYADDKTLIVKGIFWDVVETLGDPCPLESTSSTMWRRIVLEWEKIVSGVLKNSNPE
jgi:hypothetical protein